MNLNFAWIRWGKSAQQERTVWNPTPTQTQSQLMNQLRSHHHQETEEVERLREMCRNRDMSLNSYRPQHPSPRAHPRPSLLKSYLQKLNDRRPRVECDM